MKKSSYLDDSRQSIDWVPQSIDWDHSHRRAAAYCGQDGDDGAAGDAPQLGCCCCRSSRTLYQYIPNLYQHHTIGYAAAPLANLLTSAARETPTAVHCLGSHQMLSAGRREN